METPKLYKKIFVLHKFVYFEGIAVTVTVALTTVCNLYTIRCYYLGIRFEWVRVVLTLINMGRVIIKF